MALCSHQTSSMQLEKNREIKILFKLQRKLRFWKNSVYGKNMRRILNEKVIFTYTEWQPLLPWYFPFEVWLEEKGLLKEIREAAWKSRATGEQEADNQLFALGRNGGELEKIMFVSENSKLKTYCTCFPPGINCPWLIKEKEAYKRL